LQKGFVSGCVRGIVSVFSGQQERPTVVASDPQRGVGLESDPAAGTGYYGTREKTHDRDSRRRSSIAQIRLRHVACLPAPTDQIGLHASNSGYSTVASAASGYQSPQRKGTTMKSATFEKALDAAAAAIGLFEVLLVPTRFSSAWERVAAADS
jgi:hypothetical protein